MVDSESFVKMVSDEPIHIPHERNRLESVPEERLHHCAPAVLGYSLVTKRWGRFDVNGFKDIEWIDREPLMTNLVLSDRKKKLIESLISVNQLDIVCDAVTNKSGGFVILLHGNPGTGKTLTAEAAAEKRRCPLMVVSAADLGYELEKMETTLQKVLQICQTWDAVLLIDEAEVYLEERSPGNIKQNAIVSVFLRLLEYHQLLIFLTTNHVERIDPAVRTRVAVTIEYPNLDERARASIWKRYLLRAGVEITDDNDDGYDDIGPSEAIAERELRALARNDLNGRYMHFQKYV